MDSTNQQEQPSIYRKAIEDRGYRWTPELEDAVRLEHLGTLKHALVDRAFRSVCRPVKKRSKKGAVAMSSKLDTPS